MESTLPRLHPLLSTTKSNTKLMMILSIATLALLLLVATAVFGQHDERKPPFWKKAETARWLAHENLWGTFSTSSLHLNKQAWGQPKSFVDGSKSNSTGVLYFYDSDMDVSVQVRSARLPNDRLSHSAWLRCRRMPTLTPEWPSAFPWPSRIFAL